MTARSPFPGMDPYLESHWRDVHASLVIGIRNALQPRLPAGLKARVEERVFVEGPQGALRGVYPDVRVIEQWQEPGSASGASTVALAEPLVLHLESEPATETYLEIVEVGSGRRVVTVIEVVSPANKAPGAGRKLYVKKQQQILASAANLVEIDLLRGGEPVLFVPRHSVPPSHRTPYLVCVRRGARPDLAYVYRAPLRERLPVIPVPLRESDDDLPLDLQELIARAYEGGGYDDLDYRSEPSPPLDAGDANWADELLRERGLRESPA